MGGHPSHTFYADPRGTLRVTGRRLGVFSAATYALAWCLPVGHISGELVGRRLWGGQAFLFALSPLFGNDIAGSPLLRTWMVASALSNLVLVVALGFVGWRPRSVSRGLAWTLAATTVANAGWFALPDARNDLRVGYYLWLAAFAFGAAAALLSVRRNSTQAGFGAAAA